MTGAGRPDDPGRGTLLLLSGLLLVLAYPPFELLLPSFLASAPFALWLAALPPGPDGRRRAARGGFALGTLYFGLTLSWLFVAPALYAPAALPAAVLPVLALSGLLALAAAGVHAARTGLGWPVWAGLPVFWTAMEWTRAHLGELSFPWLGLGETLASHPRLVGAADVVGGRGLTFWVVLVGALIASLLRRGAGRGSGALLLGLAVAVGAPTAYSLHRWRALSPEPVAEVGVVQPSVPEDVKLSFPAAIDSTYRSVNALVRGELAGRKGELDLVVLPETTIPLRPLDPVPAEGWPGLPGAKRWMASTARGLEAPVLFGGLGTDAGEGGAYRRYNSAFLLDARGRRRGRYDKRRLVPFVEASPFPDPARVPFLDGVPGGVGGLDPGRTGAPMRADGLRFGVLVCYESIFADLSRSYRRRGARFLVNVTNDAWFGRREPAWARTSALWQHPAHLVIRAVENRVGIVRSANTGISGVVDPRGRLHHRTPLFEPRAFTATVETVRSTPAFVRYGDVIGWASVLAALGAALASSMLRPFTSREDPRDVHD